ncbi:hypothetical protein [Rhodoferax sp. GW822-FHT02A01]|uniref:hypothetical protein n=1 Tax=Rhodoferax sp. GW822-FHT02A01 TaxID=3141537 RepID=UPI00315D4036
MGESLALDLLDAPPKQPQVFEVLDSFERALNLLEAVSDSDSRSGIQKILDDIDAVKKNPHLIGRASVESTQNESLYSYNKTNSLYSLFKFEPASPEIENIWYAMVATALPGLFRLERRRKEDPISHADHMYQVTLAMRNLKKCFNHERVLMLEMPDVPTSAQKYAEEMEKVFQHFDIRMESTGKYRQFYLVHRLLSWQEGDALVDVVGPGYRPRTGERAPRRKSTLDADIKEYQRKTFFVDESHTETHIRKISTYFERPNRREAEQEKFAPDLEAEIKPVESTLELLPGKVMQYHFRRQREGAGQRARYAVQAIELQNQQLPITYSNLSEYEIQLFLENLDRWKSSLWRVIPNDKLVEVSLWAACRYLFSRSPDQLINLRISTNAETPRLPTWNPQTKRITFSTLSPKHKASASTALSIPVGAQLTLEVPTLVQVLIELVKVKSGLIFKSSKEELERYFSLLLNSINAKYKVALSAHRLQNTMAEHISTLAPNDPVLACYFTGAPPNSHMPAVYSAVPENRIQQLFIQAWERYSVALKEDDWDGSRNFELPSLIDFNHQFVGSMQVPQNEMVKSTVHDLLTRLNADIANPGVSISRRHNSYTAYVCFMLLVLTGIRSLTTLLPGAMDVDWKSGICFASEKDNSRYSEARLVYMLPLVVEQLQSYLQHVRQLRKYLVANGSEALVKLDARHEEIKLSNHIRPDRSADLNSIDGVAPMVFMLGESGSTMIEVKAKQLQQYMGDKWSMRIGATRHFIRTALLLGGTSGELIDALLGHWIRGAEPWGVYSSLPPRIWKSELKSRIDQMATQLGFKALKPNIFR